MPQVEGKTKSAPVAGRKDGLSEQREAVLVPENPTVGDTLKVEIAGGGGENIPPFTVSWYVNEDLFERGGDNLDLSSLRRGDWVYAEVEFDAQGYETLVTGVTSIANSPPRIISLDTETAAAGGAFFLQVNAAAVDPDGDAVAYGYRFFVNDEPVHEGSGRKLDITKLKRGDRVYCAVSPSDGQIKGEEKTTPLFRIANRPPRIVSRPPDNLAGDIYTYKLAGQDPDGDELSFELVEGPEGMILMEDTLHWDVRTFDGNLPIKAVVKASDGYGGDATQEFNLSVA
ncbi:MAG: hypothetical protein GTO00_11635, partial [Deltaproteobacteria bacterium]|nr:hypothetical protein [Deltaproteobacteria bacterium]